MTDRVLLLTPSQGRGGGIERYAQTLERAFGLQGVDCHRIDLRGSGLSAHAHVLAAARRHLRVTSAQTRLIVAHRALLPVAWILSKEHASVGVSLVCHGSDVWGPPLRARWLIEKWLMRRPGVRVVAASSFTAGVLLPDRPATVLPPGLSPEWFHMLVEASAVGGKREPGVHLLTAFRLADWRAKGLAQLLEAVTTLGRPDVWLTICGSGEPPPELLKLVRMSPNCVLKNGLSDQDLAREFATADLFVLATRTRHGRKASGEGFGLVLLEAQVAGTPVVAPAYGGSHDAYLAGITGVTPVDERSDSLARVIDELLKDPLELTQMGERAAIWARESFAPDRHASQAVARLL